MTWSEGDTWTLTLDLPAGKHEFKVASAPAKGNNSDGVWEDGPNRSVQASRALLCLLACWASTCCMLHGVLRGTREQEVRQPASPISQRPAASALQNQASQLSGSRAPTPRLSSAGACCGVDL